MTSLNIRRATIEDLDGIIRFTRPYFDESVWGKHTTYSEEQARARFTFCLNDLETFLAECDDEIIAMATLSLEKIFSEELTGDYEFFFVSRVYRGCGVSRLLQEFCEGYAKGRGAKLMCASGASGVSDGLWVNLFRKFRYEKIGTVMVKVF